jgi:hypothetical protein
VIELTTQRSFGVVSTHRRIGPAAALAVVGLLTILVLSSVPSTAATPSGAAATATPTSDSTGSATAFNPNCAPIVPGVCVSVQSATEPDIVPPAGSFSSTVEPSANQSLPLVIKSEAPLNGSGTASPRSGPDAPVILNVTGTLWNGAPYYSLEDGSVYHSATGVWWDGPVNTTNTTYPWWYVVNLSALSPAGQPNFFPGMSISWSIEITYNVSGNFIHEGSPQSNPAGPVFHFRYKGAWAFSPDAGAGQYDGAAAFDQDLTTTRVPAAPNWNDSVTLTLNSTPFTIAQGAGVGQAYVDLTETSANGTYLGSTSLSFGNSTSGSAAYPRVHFVIPATYAQQAGATIRYEIHAADGFGDWIESGYQTYVVGGNGSFIVGQFGDDLALTTNPSVTTPVAPIAPGTPVELSLSSQNSGTAIASATVFYTVDLPLLHEVSTFSSRFERVNSTSFIGEIPGLPVGSGVNFTVEAWDFSSTGEISPNYNYSVASLATLLPSIATNGTFFYVGVQNGGNDAWVNGAVVSIVGPGGYFKSVGSTYAGLAYPNATLAPYSPIVVPAGQTYVINVSDPGVRADGAALEAGVQVNLSATHLMGAHSVLAVGNGYTIYQNGDLVVFLFNGTTPAPSASTPDLTPVLIGSILGVAAVALIVFPLMGWWRRIQKRREEETKRVTL